MTEYQADWGSARPEDDQALRDERMWGAGYATAERIERGPAGEYRSAPGQHSLDPVELASMDSFPCSDPPGHGHA